MIRVLSCNLFRGRADAAALEDIVGDRGIDVVCAQEVSVALAGRLAAMLPHGDVAQDRALRGNAVACRYPVAARRIPIPRRSGCVVRLAPPAWPGITRPIEIVNVHIAAPHLWPYFPRRVRRHAQLETLLADRRLSQEEPQAIIGDFNASPCWPVYRRMAARYADAALADRPGVMAGPTWPRLTALGLDGLLRIDHCFLRGLDVRSCTTLRIPGSDHLGLLVELALP